MGGAHDKSKMPDDFPIQFVELGRVGCELEYGVGRKRIVSYLEQSGRKAELIRKREAYVKMKRREESEKSSRRDRKVTIEVEDKRVVDRRLVERAARHLQRSRHGGWVVYPVDKLRDHWIVGTKRRSGAQVVDIAISKGFDVQRAKRQIKAFGE